MSPCSPRHSDLLVPIVVVDGSDFTKTGHRPQQLSFAGPDVTTPSFRTLVLIGRPDDIAAQDILALDGGRRSSLVELGPGSESGCQSDRSGLAIPVETLVADTLRAWSIVKLAAAFPKWSEQRRLQVLAKKVNWNSVVAQRILESLQPKTQRTADSGQGSETIVPCLLVLARATDPLEPVSTSDDARRVGASSVIVFGDGAVRYDELVGVPGVSVVRNSMPRRQSPESAAQ